MRMLRLLVVCIACVVCHAPPSWARVTDPVTLIASVSATAPAFSEPPPEAIAEASAPRPARQCPERPDASLDLPQIQADPTIATRDPAPPIQRYLRNCALLR